MTHRVSLRATLGLLLYAIPAPAETTVGMPGTIENLVLPGTELTARRLDDRTSPIVIRIVRTYPHETAFRYDIEYAGLEPGTHDLRQYLRHKDGSSTADLPPIPVTVAAVLPPGQVLPNALEIQEGPRVGGYLTLRRILGTIWVLGLAAILVSFVYPRRRRAVAAAGAPVTLADRLRPSWPSEPRRAATGGRTVGPDYFSPSTRVGWRAAARSWPAFAAVLAAGPGLAQPPAPPGRAHPDSVPLPVGAVARLGSARFRIAGEPHRWIAFSADGKLLACGHTRGTSVFEVATGRPVRHLRKAERGWAPSLVRFLADGKRLAVGTLAGDGARLTFHPLAGGEPTTALHFPEKPSTMVVDVTPDGSRALMVDNLEKAYLWDVKAGRELWSCGKPNLESVLPLAADGKSFALFNDVAELHDPGTGNLVAKFPSWRRDSSALGQLPDGRLALSNSRSQRVALLTAGDGAGVRTFASDRMVRRFAGSPDSRYLAGVGTYGTQDWDTTAAEGAGPVAQLPPAGAAGFSPDGKVLALADVGYVALYSVGDWKLLPQSADPPSPVYRLRVTDDGKRVLGLTRDSWVTWPVGGGPSVPMPDGLTGIRARGYMGSQVLAAVSADGRVAVDAVRPPGKGLFDGPLVLSVVEAGGGKPRTIPMEYQPGNPISLTPDGRYVVVSAVGRATRVYDARSGEVLFRQNRARDEWVLAARPAADGRGLVRSVVATWPGNDGNGPSYTQIAVTDHVTGKSWTMNPMPWFLYDGVRFGRDGTRLFGRGRYDNVSEKDTVSVWDVRTGRRLVAWTGAYGLDGHDLSADNRSLLVGDDKGRVTLIEAATGAERTRFEQGGMMLSAAFVPDGSRAVVASTTAPAYVWDLVGKPGGWDPAKADAVWADLASPDAKTAFAAIRKLRANPGEAVSFLEARVKLPAAPADERVAQWLKDLDAPRFAVREQAQRELTNAADAIRPKLEAARAKATFEAGRRLDEILKAADGWPPEQLRRLRASEVLEGIRTPDAGRVLKGWAGGPPGARLTVEAQESVARIGP